MDLHLIIAIVPSAIAALSAVAVAVIESRSSKARKHTESRNERRERESRLSMKLMNSTCSLSVVTAKKVAGQETNGDLEAALNDAKAAQREYSDFLADIAAHHVSK